MLIQKIKDVWSQKRGELELRQAQIVQAIAEKQTELEAINLLIAELDSEIIEVDTLEIKK